MDKRLVYTVKLAKSGFGRYKHAAVLVNNGQVLASGVNTRRGVSADYSEDAWRGSHVHAELVVISIAGHRAKGATLYVARIGKDGVARPSEPCIRCQSAIKRAGIKRVVHT
jgi:tRNA(Arg) A34 adenosine deaminase TadA